jgi:hypothetical protein
MGFYTSFLLNSISSLLFLAIIFTFCILMKIFYWVTIKIKGNDAANQSFIRDGYEIAFG